MESLDRAKRFVVEWQTTLKLALFNREEYRHLKRAKIEDCVEVGAPMYPSLDGSCYHEGTRKYFLMFGEEICRSCNEWTGRMKGVDI